MREGERRTRRRSRHTDGFSERERDRQRETQTQTESERTFLTRQSRPPRRAKHSKEGAPPHVPRAGRQIERVRERDRERECVCVTQRVSARV